MELIDRYLQAVANNLPEASRADIAEELRSSLYEQVDESRQQLGRDLNEQELSNLLKKWGHPVKVAGSYSPAQYLIGPSLFPAYVYTLKIAAGVVLTIQIVITVLALFTTNEWFFEFPALFNRLIWSMLGMAGIVTGVFAILEYSGEKLDWYENWDPKKLVSADPAMQINKSDVITNISFETIMLLWWNDAFEFNYFKIVTDGLEWTIGLSPGWAEFYWPINVLLLLGIILHCYQLFFPIADLRFASWITTTQWNFSKIIAEITLDIASLIVVFKLIKLKPLLELSGALSVISEDVRRSLEITETAVWYTLMIIGCLLAYDFYKHNRVLSRMRKFG